MSWIATFYHQQNAWGGAVDFEAGVYRERVPLGRAMQYLAVLGPLPGVED